MEKDTNEIEKEIEKLEAQIASADFWQDKMKAQSVLRELALLKNKLGGVQKYDRGNAIVTIISGAGGDDAEDWAHMLLEMYRKYADKKNWGTFFIHENKNEHGGYRSVSFEVEGK